MCTGIAWNSGGRVFARSQSILSPHALIGRILGVVGSYWLCVQFVGKIKANIASGFNRQLSRASFDIEDLYTDVILLCWRWAIKSTEHFRSINYFCFFVTERSTQHATSQIKESTEKSNQRVFCRRKPGQLTSMTSGQNTAMGKVRKRNDSQCPAHFSNQTSAENRHSTSEDLSAISGLNRLTWPSESSWYALARAGFVEGRTYLASPERNI